MYAITSSKLLKVNLCLQNCTEVTSEHEIPADSGTRSGINPTGFSAERNDLEDALSKLVDPTTIIIFIL